MLRASVSFRHRAYMLVYILIGLLLAPGAVKHDARNNENGSEVDLAMKVMMMT